MKGQIIKIVSNLYTVNCSGTIYECHSRGKFRNENITPVVGDYVVIDEKNKYILEVESRKNRLIRPMVSNIDQGLIITSVKIPDFSTNLLDKLITLMEINDVEPVICFTKMDLLDKDEELEIFNYIH
jgi:ribosome biogenesis GTPase